MNELTYVAVWPITNRDRPVGALITEATRDLDVMIQLAGAQIPTRAKPRWDVSIGFDALVCHVPVVPYTAAGDPVGRVTPLVRAQIERLAINGHTVEEIAQSVAVSESTVKRYIAKARGPRRA